MAVTPMAYQGPILVLMALVILGAWTPGANMHLVARHQMEKIYQWANNTGTVAAVLSNAPTSVNAIVAPERFVFALGAGGAGNKVQWCDQENNNLWAAAATNQAGDFYLEHWREPSLGMAMRGETLMITDTDAHVARYQGPPFVFWIY